MTRHYSYVEQTRWWVDVLSGRAITVVRLSPELRRRYARIELMEQERNAKSGNDRREAVAKPAIPVLQQMLARTD